MATATSQPVTQRYVPRFKRDPNAVPSVRLYSQLEIARRIPGQGNHTFTRGFAEESRADVVHPGTLPTGELPEAEHDARRLTDEFCRIMVHDKAHLAPPKELWTRHNIDQLDMNIGRPFPLFQETVGKKFEFLGWYQILRWQRCTGDSTSPKGRPSPQLVEFIRSRKMSQTDRSEEYWRGVLRDDWARVELGQVDDSRLGNPMSPKI